MRELAKVKAAIESQYPSVKANQLTAVDRQQRIWVGVRDNLLRFDGHRWTDLSAEINHPYSVTFVKADSNGCIWVGTSGKGVYRFDAGRVDSFFNEENRSISVIYSMAEAKDGTVYVGTQYGLYAFAGQEPETITASYQVLDVLVDGLGRVWFSDPNYGLLLYDGGKVRDVFAIPSCRVGVERISLIGPGTVRVDTYAYGPTGSREGSFECDGTSVKSVKREKMSGELP